MQPSKVQRKIEIDSKYKPNIWVEIHVNLKNGEIVEMKEDPGVKIEQKKARKGKNMSKTITDTKYR